MKRPDVVVFDLGKVLVDFDYGIAAQRFSTKCATSPEKIKELIDQTPLLLRFETGLMTNHEFYREVCALTGFSGCETEFSEMFADIFTAIEPMVRLHDTLRRKMVPTYIFSNTNEFAVHHIRRTFPFFNHFSDYILSYEHRAMKPEARIYEVVEHRSGKRGEAIFYIDDRRENIEAGQQRGWQTMLHTTPDSTIRRCCELQLVSLEEADDCRNS
jgi:HAD superfamily hydrolase (TIGR01509 family)